MAGAARVKTGKAGRRGRRRRGGRSRRRSALQKTHDRDLKNERLLRRVVDLSEGLDRQTMGNWSRAEVDQLVDVRQQLDRAADTLALCGQAARVFRCPEHGLWVQTWSCNHRLCHHCQTRRTAQLLQTYEDRMGTGFGGRVPLLTKTQLQVEGEGFRDCKARMGKKEKKFRRQLLAVLGDIGGITAFEVTDSKTHEHAFHGHTHTALDLRDAVLPEDWTLPGSRRGGPISPWRLRLLWVRAHLDMRTRAARVFIGSIQPLIDRGHDLWAAKLSCPRDSEARDTLRQEETAALRELSAICRPRGIACSVDIRQSPLRECLKYISKGIPDLPDWHLTELIVGTKGLRRVDAWGTLRQQHEEDDGDESPALDEEDDDPRRRCPVCLAGCDVFSDHGAAALFNGVPSDRELHAWAVDERRAWDEARDRARAEGRRDPSPRDWSPD